MVEQLMTVWNGMCLKIKFEYFSLDLAPTFNIAFSKSLTLADVPTPEVYLTSEENAYGIINYGWVNGEELKIVLEGVEQVLLWNILIDNYLKMSIRSIFSGYQTICITSKIHQLHFNM